MALLFGLGAQKCGVERHVKVETDGLGVTLDRDGSLSRPRSINEAIRDAHHYIGVFLQPAERGGIPWGLLVRVSDGAAAYGEWPLAGGGSQDPSFRNTPLVRIWERRNESGPLSALANAMEIVRAYAGRGASRQAA